MEQSKRMILVLAFLVALALTSYPFLLRLLYHRQAQQSILRFAQAVSSDGKTDSGVPAQSLEEALTEALTEPDEQAEPEQSELLSDLFVAMQQYNLHIWQNQQADLDSVEDYETPALDVTPCLGTDTVGVISIPAMEVELPLYLGASKSNMARGAVIMGGTSCPIGGENTNCVIAAHRGYSGIPYFREIERLSTGDSVTITNPWETLTYIVTDWEIVTPDSLDLVHIQPGRDMVTLVTCHPYRVGTQRYLVYCERTTASAEIASEAASEAVSGFSEPEGNTMPATEKTPPAVLEEPSMRMLSTEEKLEYAAPVIVVLAGVWMLLEERKKVFDTAENGDYNQDRE